MVSSKNPFICDTYIVYGYFFNDMDLYIGSTVNEISRKKDHLRRGPVFAKIISGIPYVYVKLEDSLSYDTVLKREQFCLDIYPTYGYHLLNKAPAVSRGLLAPKWTPNRINEEASKYSSFIEWRKKSKSSYNAAHRRGLLKHMKTFYKNKITSNYDIFQDALKYSSKSEWRTNSPNLVRIAYKRNIINECCKHMNKKIEWDNDMIIEDAAKYKSIKDWRESKSPAYYLAHKLKIMNLCKQTFMTLRRQRTDDEIISDASKYTSKSEWKAQDSSGYTLAIKRKIFKECEKAIIDSNICL